MNKEELEGLEHIRESLLRTRERAKSSMQIEAAVWDIWRYAHSEKDCKVPQRPIAHIRGMLGDAIKLIEARLEDSVAAHQKTRAKLSAMSKDMRVVRERNKVLDNRLKESRDRSKKGGIVGIIKMADASDDQ